MCHIGIPVNYMNGVMGLQKGSLGITTIPGTKPVRFPILQGVPQGCPLSPLLFNLSIDLLRHHINRSKGLNAQAFADFTSVRIQSGKYLEAVATIYEEFGKATGLIINIKKTKDFNKIMILDLDSELNKKRYSI